MNKNEIKEIIANILYLNSTDEITDDVSIFSVLGLSSIDYIDLCFELSQKSGINLNPENLWPINKLMLEKKYYENAEWTESGWDEVCNVIGLQKDIKKLGLKNLYDYFTVNYIEKRLADLI